MAGKIFHQVNIGGPGHGTVPRITTYNLYSSIVTNTSSALYSVWTIFRIMCFPSHHRMARVRFPGLPPSLQATAGLLLWWDRVGAGLVSHFWGGGWLATVGTILGPIKIFHCWQ